jgi:hypothetical protein
MRSGRTGGVPTGGGRRSAGSRSRTAARAARGAAIRAARTGRSVRGAAAGATSSATSTGRSVRGAAASATSSATSSGRSVRGAAAGASGRRRGRRIGGITCLRSLSINITGRTYAHTIRIKQIIGTSPIRMPTLRAFKNVWSRTGITRMGALVLINRRSTFWALIRGFATLRTSIGITVRTGINSTGIDFSYLPIAIISNMCARLTAEGITRITRIIHVHALRPVKRITRVTASSIRLTLMSSRITGITSRTTTINRINGECDTLGRCSLALRLHPDGHLNNSRIAKCWIISRYRLRA